LSPVATLTIQLHKAQADFLDSNAKLRGFVGGRGAGKSFIGAYDLLRRAKPRRLYVAIEPTYTMLKDAAWRMLLMLGERLHYIANINRSELRITLGNGAEILCRSGDEPDRQRGINASGIWLDEASQMTRELYEVVIPSLREGGEQGWLSATFTPRGRSHWTYEVFASGNPEVALFHATSLDNPFLSLSLIETVRGQYTSLMAQQEIEGQFVDLAGGLFRRQWFTIVDAAPADCRRVRYWDLAATEARQGSDPDWTVGVLLGVKDGIYYVIDVRRTRSTPRQVEALVRQTAELDGPLVPIWMEQEPGSSGVNTIDHYTRHVLSGYTFRPDRVTGNKLTRMHPLAAQVEAGNVRLVRAAWNSAYLDEAEAIPSGNHDDQIDATAGAFTRLQVHGVPFGFVREA